MTKRYLTWPILLIAVGIVALFTVSAMPESHKDSHKNKRDTGQTFVTANGDVLQPFPENTPWWVERWHTWKAKRFFRKFHRQNYIAIRGAGVNLQPAPTLTEQVIGTGGGLARVSLILNELDRSEAEDEPRAEGFRVDVDPRALGTYRVTFSSHNNVPFVRDVDFTSGQVSESVIVGANRFYLDDEWAWSLTRID